MAVSISRRPARVTGLDDTYWKFEMDTASTLTIKKLLKIQLQRNGVDVGEELTFPYSAQGWTLTFPQLVKQALSTTPPTLDSQPITLDNSISDTFRFRYWEQTVDTINKTTTNTDTTVNDGDYTVFNSRCPYYLDTDYFNPDYIVFSDRPQNNIIGRQQEDWLYLHAGNATRIRATIRTLDGATFASIATLTTGQVNIIPVGTKQGFWTSFISDDRVAYYTIEVETPLLGFETVYRFDVQGDCGEQDCVDFIFQEAKGGYASIRFEENKAIQATRTADNFTCEPDIPTTAAERCETLGRQSKNAQLSKTFTVTKKLKFEMGYERFLDSLFASNNVFLKRFLNGSYKRTRVTINNATYRTYQANTILRVTMTVTLSNRVKSNV